MEYLKFISIWPFLLLHFVDMMQRIHIVEVENLAVGTKAKIKVSENQVIMNIIPFMNNIWNLDIVTMYCLFS